jgi:hypothetical protein
MFQVFQVMIQMMEVFINLKKQLSVMSVINSLGVDVNVCINLSAGDY